MGSRLLRTQSQLWGKKHKLHIDAYGTDNHLRLTGAHETASIHEFSSGIGNRGCSIRIPTETGLNKKGYFEDRRPASNMNPYVVTALIAETCTKGVDDDTSEISPNQLHIDSYSQGLQVIFNILNFCINCICYA